jgi:hypothetical protein
VGLGALGALVVGGAAAGVGIGSFGWIISQLGERIVTGSPERIVARLDVEGTGDVIVRGKHLSLLQLLHGADNTPWRLTVPHDKNTVSIHGEAAVLALGKLLPQLNRFGGSRERVREAVSLIEQETDPTKLFDTVAQQAAKRDKPKISGLPEATRLALEMASHEESERRVLEGELTLLEHAWKEAEEVAAIADNLFLPSFVEDWMRTHRKG